MQPGGIDSYSSGRFGVSSPAQQYIVSPYINEPVFAHCEFKRADLTGKVRMLQLAQKPISVKAEIAGLEADTMFEIRVHEAGDVGGKCTNLGEKFNPLQPEDQ